MNEISGLNELEQQIQRDFEYLNLPINPWVLSGNQIASQKLDVAIIGGGMSGITAAFALKLKGVNAMVFDQAKDGQEGPWIKPALMETLRSPKHVLGPAMASPSLSFQAWFKAQFGHSAWEQLDKIPRLQWGEYLQWFKKITQPQIQNEYCLIDLTVLENGSELTFQTPTGIQQYFAEHIILAMGMESFSEPNIPKFMNDIPNLYWEHSYAGTDYSRFKDRDIAVVGYSAGAMDSSATALENGAKSVEILIRASDMPRVNRGKVAGNAGFSCAYQHFTDAQKWHYSDYVAKAKTPAPHGSTLRVSRHSNAYFNFDSPILDVSLQGEKLNIRTPDAVFIVDYLILATGYRITWDKKDALAQLSPYIKTWADAYEIPEDEENSGLASQPYVSRYFQLQAKDNLPLAGIERLYCFNLSASVSMGPVIGLIPGTNVGAERVAEKIVSQLYLDHYTEHLDLVKRSTEDELLGNEWQIAVPYSERLKQAEGAD